MALWVYVDREGRSVPLRDWFFDVYRNAADDRLVTSRLRLPAHPPAGAAVRAWPLRVTDVDVFAHVNNAASWAAVEDELARRCPERALVRAEMEYRAPVDLDDPVELRSVLRPDGLDCWLTRGDAVRTAAVVGTR